MHMGHQGSQERTCEKKCGLQPWSRRAAEGEASSTSPEPKKPQQNGECQQATAEAGAKADCQLRILLRESQ